MPGQGGMTTMMTTMCQTLRRTSRLPPRPNRSFYPLALLCIVCGGGGWESRGSRDGLVARADELVRICKYSYCLFLVARVCCLQPRNLPRNLQLG